MEGKNCFLSNGWSTAKIAEVCDLNPKHGKHLQDNLEISFVPMAAVSDDRGEIENPEIRNLGQVRKGYTHFANGDVIWAKITPCMENGKAALAINLKNGLACGSTEFYVLRPNGSILPKYLYFYVRQKDFRDRAKAKMTSAAGHARVPKDFLLQDKLRIPPLNEQKRIVAKIEELQSHSRRARETLETTPDLLEQLRQSILAAAFRGNLTKKWREQHKGQIEPASELLKRIRIERRKRWEAAELDKLKAKGLTGDQLGTQFTKRRKQYQEPAPVNTTDLPELPEGWCWASWDMITYLITSGSRGWANYYADEGSIFIRAQDINSDELLLDDIAFVSLPDKAEGLRTLVKQNDLLVTITGANVTKAALVGAQLKEAYVSQHGGRIAAECREGSTDPDRKART